MSFEAKLFSSPETIVVGQQQKAKIEMRMKATALCAKSLMKLDQIGPKTLFGA